MKKHSADNLRERVELLDFTLTDEGWKWVKYAEVWAGVELTGKTCLFSKLGIGARAAEVILRSRALTLHQAIRWRGQHLFLSEITEPDRGWLDIQAAVVELTECRYWGAPSQSPTATAPPEGEPETVTFPGVLTVKYLSHTQDTPMAVGTGDYVLVTPKEIRLKPGRVLGIGINPTTALGAVPLPLQGRQESLEDDGGRVMLVRIANTIDPYKNEYELREEMDL